ncbi:MAG: 2-amino-5-chloromuconic acid deaminase [Acinetobacter bereziniae]|uniref:2-amino-5-chloromuconic acid deaminase n=1 Tax=Acinetobacter bereziniae TaxID=106648 RepID=A0A833PA00_ACIBZ|nr:MAG: 2-amino-5-chloromuconic acid deaminase [Acinetobacter bereziniae]
MDDAVSLSIQYAQATTDPIQELERAVDAVRQVNDHIFISLSLDRAFREAKAAKARRENGAALSLFDGIPIAWKDLFDMQGTVTTAGSKTRVDHAIAQQDADVVMQLTRIGMVNLGKTNLTEFAYSGLGLNPHFGTPKNVTDPLCIPGGSSSGAAISVGQHIVPISMGTDTAGSIRIPASFNGLVGYRSSRSRYSKKGVFPLAASLDSVGPISRSVRDCIVLDQLMLGQIQSNIPSQPQAKNMQIYVDLDMLNHPSVQDCVKHNFLQTIEKIKQADIRVVHKRISAFDQAQMLIDSGQWLGAAEAYTLHEALLHSDQAEFMDQRVRKRLLSAKDTLASSQIHLYQMAQHLKANLKTELTEGFLLTPTTTHTAPELAPLEADEALFTQTNLNTLRLTMPGSFLDMPSISLPNGTDSNGRPTGILLSSYSGNDQSLLSAALSIEHILRNND